MSGTYTQRGVNVQAIPAGQALIYSKSNWAALPDWLKRAYESGNVIFGHTKIYINRNDELSDIEVPASWWLIYSPNGELFACTQGVFEVMYTKSDE